ncbi:hypothetical protein [Proteus sp. ZN5]|uniref:hypothetical protein n=1 Tax=Proteus sp. ZN5 TaxID=2697019 RepID=UPI0013E18EE0|nr:hypothetical protein [Proteus sp. ZN5]QIG06221.1 hypothetical protein GTK47_13165 [Proteus sp. ZN5]QIG06234.1 hypothetical protein GTK47_13230 [Proteus sp. ZN5]
MLDIEELKTTLTEHSGYQLGLSVPIGAVRFFQINNGADIDDVISLMSDLVNQDFLKKTNVGNPDVNRHLGFELEHWYQYNA